MHPSVSMLFEHLEDEDKVLVIVLILDVTSCTSEENL
jgi:hypothetical protein